MFEQTFKNLDDVPWKEAGCTGELDAKTCSQASSAERFLLSDFSANYSPEPHLAVLAGVGHGHHDQLLVDVQADEPIDGFSMAISWRKARKVARTGDQTSLPEKVLRSGCSSAAN